MYKGQTLASGSEVFIISAWYGVESQHFGKPYPVAKQVLYVVTTSLDRAKQYLEDYFNQKIELTNDVSPTLWYGYVDKGTFTVSIEKTYVY